MVILLTGFEPFGEDAVNPTEEIVKAFPEEICGAKIVKAVLPVEFARGPETAVSFARRVRPDAILCLGLAGGREAITPERTAVNVMDARIPDGCGFQPADEKICLEGENAYFSTLPFREMIRRLSEEGIPARLSESAGTYVCNCLMYRMLRFVGEEMPGVPCGFVHVPYSEEMGKEGKPSLPLAEMIRGIELCVETLVS